MSNVRKPRRGSLGYSPRKRAPRAVPRISSWPRGGDKPKIQGFAGFKAGMTHSFIVDWRKTSTTAGREIVVPVTVLEVPPMKVVAVRLYEYTTYGLTVVGEVWAPRLDKNLARRFPTPKEYEAEHRLPVLRKLQPSEVRVMMCTQPYLVTGIPSKVPDIMEVRVGGGKVEEQVEYAISLLGKDVNIRDFISEGKQLDVVAVTRGKGFQGVIKRWGVKKLPHKSRKHVRAIANAGPKRPGYVRPTVPQGGQTGFQTRTEINKRVLKIGDSGEEINPMGGFPHYGAISNPYIVVSGSVPGPQNRVIRLRDAIRPTEQLDAVQLVYVSTSSKQGA
jgi:large subunit ribosomal protein L3